MAKEEARRRALTTPLEGANADAVAVSVAKRVVILIFMMFVQCSAMPGE